MSLYTIVFILVTILILAGLALFGLFISKLDKWIDRRERLGKESVYKGKIKSAKVETEKETNSV
ncbi:MAG: hypothetical protein RDU14_04620 [Melioribacteraceae bacterium]|nr:hypothetical protein [Melioribacteraceae bacterium]